jgi:outer membrane protein assembly factor BamB
MATARGAGANGDWMEWRGPTANGVSGAKNVPVKWTNEENVRWKLALPNGSGATPIVHGGKIYLTGVKDGKNIVFCVGMDGKQQWEVALGDSESPKHRQKGSASHPSPATDGERLYVYYRSGEFACLDMMGKMLWRKNLQELYGEDTLYWDLGTSPALTKDYVLVATLHDPPSYVVAFEKATGDVAWKLERNLPAPRESHQSYSTPIVLVEDGVEKFYLLGSDHVTAHMVSDGTEIWRVGGFNPGQATNFRSIASPVLSAGILAAPYARGRTLTGLRIDGKGDVTDSHVVWCNHDFGSDVPTPTAIDGKLYTATDRGEFACLDIKTGEPLWSGELPARGTVSASPILADGKIYITNEEGTTFVLAQGDKFEVLPLDGTVLIRTYENLYCIGE